MDAIEQHERETPEPKLELIDGRLIIGNNLRGSRYILHDLACGWTPAAVLPFAQDHLWLVALHEAFAQWNPPAPEADLSIWQLWAATVEYEPVIEPAGPRITGPHYFARERINGGLHAACGHGRFGVSLGHDFVMRLGDNGFTPDGILIGRQATERLFSKYLNGPADLIIEILMPGHENQDREVKRRHYEEGGVSEYWIVNPEKRIVEFLRLSKGKYHSQKLNADGCYRPVSVPGLAFFPERMWEGSQPRDVSPFEVESALPAGWTYNSQQGIDWDDIAF
jgi:hypothetical protein